MTKQMAKEHTLIQMELSTLENGRMISKMDLEFRNGQMVKNMRDSIKMERRQVKVCLNFWMGATTKASF